VFGLAVGSLFACLLAQAKLAALQATLQHERRQAEERLAVVHESQQKLADAFKALAAEALQCNNQSFLDLARTTLERLHEAAQGDLEQNPRLIELGGERNVILAAPTTLIALLLTVAYGWRQERLAQNAQEISDLGKELYKRLGTVARYISHVEKGLDRAIDAYNKAVVSLESRVLVTACKSQDLGTATDIELDNLVPAEITGLGTRPHRGVMSPDPPRSLPEPPMNDNRLLQQIEFLVEIDKLKHVFRQTYLINQSRKENDAEHSWHLAVAAILLHEYADDPKPDLLRVIKMVLIHDLVEIDAGDTYAYDAAAAADQAAREQRAADRLFGMLPSDQAREFRQLWEEMEARQTSEARFAAALDRLQPFLWNYRPQGRAWLEHEVTSDRVYTRMRPVVDGSAKLWDLTEAVLQDAIRKGYLTQ